MSERSPTFINIGERSLIVKWRDDVVTTREKIVDAARRVMQKKGLSQATTKEIAQAAGVSEGSLYNHFKNKSDLFLCVLQELPSNFIELIKGLRERAGSGTVHGNLEELATAALAFYDVSIPMGASFFSDPALLALHRKGLKERGAGPHKANLAVAAYLRKEQTLGRVRADANPEVVAYLFLGACFQRAYWTQFLGEKDSHEAEGQFIHDLLKTITQGLLLASN